MTEQDAKPGRGQGEARGSKPRKAAALKAAIQPREGTINKILAGATQALQRRGARRLSLSEVCELAGVSRVTLYTHFPTKDALLEAVADHQRQVFAKGIHEALAQHTKPASRLRAAMTFVHDYIADQRTDLGLESEPHFVMASIRKNFDSYVSTVQNELSTVFDAIQADTNLSVNRRLMTETIMRNYYSMVLIPGTEPWLDLPEQVLLLWTMLSKGAAAAPNS